MESSSKQSDDGMEEQNQKSDDRMGDTDQKSDEGNVCMGDTRANCQNQLSSDMAVSNDPEMLPSTSSREISSIQSISVDILQEDDPQEVTSSFGDPIHQTSNTATVGSTSSCKTMASNASFSELWPIVWLAMCIVVLVIKILQNNFHPAPYDHDLQDPWRRCATMADSTTNHQNLSPVDSPLLELPRTDFTIQEEGIRRGADVQFTNNTMRPEARQGSDEEDQSLLEISQQTSVNGTNNEESYMDSMFRQERSHSQINHQDVIRISSNNWMTRSTDMCPDINETTSSEGEEVQSNITTRPPENRPQGIPHEGWVYIKNTCSLDQFLNALYQVCWFTPIRNQLEDLAHRFPEAYERLWRALLLCEEGQSPSAKFELVPKLDLHNCEGRTIMPLIERQLCHWFTSFCQRCKGWTDPSQYLCDVRLSEFNLEGGLQEALRSAFSRPNRTCSRQRCGGRANTRVEFELRNPPMFLAINLYRIAHLIPNSGSINFTEVVELFGERYMIFLFTLAQPEALENGLFIPGHYMSYVFRPERGGEFGRDGRPVGNWFFYPNNLHGDMEPWTPGQADPAGTNPSYIYLIRIPPSSSGGATSGQEEEGPTRMAGTVPLASDNVIPETKDDRMENQVHEGVVESSPQREGEVVNSSPQPDGGVVESCPQCEGVARPGSDKEDQSLLEISQPTSVNGTSNKESYMDIMLRQKRSHSPINHQDVIRISSNNWMTSSTDMGPDSDEATSSEGEELQSNITSRPPENRPQGVPHGGRVYLRNTCSLDQFLNGLYQVCQFTPIRNQLEKLVRRFPDAYELLWRALLLCEEERFPEAKHVLVPRLNMYSNEYLQIRTLLEGQLHHWLTSLCCECEDWISISQNLTEILLNEFNPEGLQEALRSIYSLPNGTCNQPGCGSRTNIRVEFELGNPPMFLAIHLRHLISNSGSINFTEVVELFGERYFLFLFTMFRPPSSEGELGHFMSYVFRPDGGTEMGTDGRPVGAWYWFPNDFDGTLERRTPGQEDPEGTFPVTAYLVQIPPSSSGEATSDQEEEGPIQKGDDNKE